MNYYRIRGASRVVLVVQQLSEHRYIIVEFGTLRVERCQRFWPCLSVRVFRTGAILVEPDRITEPILRVRGRDGGFNQRDLVDVPVDCAGGRVVI